MDDKRLDRLEDKIDIVVTRIGAVDSTLSAQHVSLTEHIRRTELLEAEVKPIKRSVAMMEGALKLLGVLAVIFEIYKALK